MLEQQRFCIYNFNLLQGGKNRYKMLSKLVGKLPKKWWQKMSNQTSWSNRWYPYQNHLQNVLEDQIAHKSKKLLVSLSLQVWFAILTQFTKYTDCLFYDAYQFEKAKRSNQIIELLSLGDMALHLRRVHLQTLLRWFADFSLLVGTQLAQAVWLNNCLL